MATTNILDLNNRLEKLENKPGGAGGDAEDIGYDNSTSHLTADNVQAAIDEVVADIADLSADDVAYDPTASGLQSINVQDAIDEVASDLSGLSADDVTYDNTDSGLSSDTVQGAIDETVNKIDNINDDLNGFCFYPVGTAIVGLVSDDSPYTDANGNYILAASTTGQSMIDDVTYKSINSTVDARGKVGADSATPFKSGGVTLVDINPEKSTDIYLSVSVTPSGKSQYIPVQGYSQIAVNPRYSNFDISFLLKDGTETTATHPTQSQNNWTSYMDIPQDAVLAHFTVKYQNDSADLFYYSLLA